MICLEFGIDRLEERADERNLERRTRDGAFVDDILDWMLLAEYGLEVAHGLPTLIIDDGGQDKGEDDSPCAQPLGDLAHQAS